MAAAALVGMVLGLWLEIYRGHLRAARPRRAGLLVRDLLFWSGATVIAAFGLYFANWLDLRLYAVCAMAFGMLLASALAGPVVRPTSGAATRLVGACATVAMRPLRSLARRRRPRATRPPRVPPEPPEKPTEAPAAPTARRDSTRRWWQHA